MDVVECDEFLKYKKILLKKYKKDFERGYNLFNKVLSKDFNNIHRKAIPISNTDCQNRIFYKYKKFKVANLKRFPIRLIYFIENDIIYLIECYCKNSRENHNSKLIKKYCHISLT